MNGNPESIFIFIDNSETSINGDFGPNRFEAQKIAIERLSRFLLQKSSSSQIGLGTLSSIYSGIHLSLTKDLPQIYKTLTNFKIGGTINLVRCIKCSFLALKKNNSPFNKKRIICFIGAETDLTPNFSKEIIKIANNEDISIDFILFGNSLGNIDSLNNLILNLNIKSLIIRITDTTLMLSDSVIASPLGPSYFNNFQNYSIISNFTEEDEIDEDILQAIQDSIKEYEEDL